MFPRSRSSHNRPGTILFRTDCGPMAGSGHVMRCLALALAWRSLGGEAVFALSAPDPLLDGLLSRRGFLSCAMTSTDAGLRDAAETLTLAREAGAQWIVSDGYRFSPGWSEHIYQDTGPRLLVVDDMAQAQTFHADLLLNHNPWASPALYTGRFPPQAILAGPKFTLLRLEFLERRNDNISLPGVASRLLVTCGATGGVGLLEKTLKALRSPALQGLETLLATGHLHADQSNASITADQLPPGLRITEHLEDMAAAMVWADMALAAAGTITWELMHLGVPSLLTVIADNQIQVAEYASMQGAARNLGRQEELSVPALTCALASLARDENARRRMRQTGRECIDGHGALRVAIRLLGATA